MKNQPTTGAQTEAVPGSPAWWLARPAPPSAPALGRPPRPLEEIISAAAELIDEVGPAEFSMRTLADRLKGGTATIYRSAGGKEELMAYVVDRVLGEVVFDGELSDLENVVDSWQGAARLRALGMLQLLTRHPNVIPLLVAQVPVGPNGLVLREQSLQGLVHFGLPPVFAGRAYRAIAHFVLGFAVQEISAEAPSPEAAAALRELFLSLDRERYPLTVAAAEDFEPIPLEQEFLDGLQFVLDGIESALRRA